jgi:hypothetical protein
MRLQDERLMTPPSGGNGALILHSEPGALGNALPQWYRPLYALIAGCPPRCA